MSAHAPSHPAPSRPALVRSTRLTIALAGLAAAVALPAFAPAAPLELVYNIAGTNTLADRAAVPGSSGAAFTNFGRVNRTPDGTKWWVIVTTNLTPATADQVLLVGSTITGNVIAREGTFGYSYTPSGGSTTTEYVNFSGAILPRLNDDLSWAHTFVPTTLTNTQRVIKVSGSNVSVIAATGDSASPPLSAGTLWGNSFASANISRSGDVAFQANNTLDTPNFTGEELITQSAKSALLFQQQAQIQSPDGTDYGLWTDFDTDGFQVADDGVTTLIQGKNFTTSVLAFNNVRVLTQGENIPGTTFGPITSIADAVLEPNGDWIARAVTATGSYYVRNGVVIAGTGLPITPGSTETWTNTFQVARSNNLGDFVVIGTTNATDTLRNEVIVINNSSVLLRESDGIDLNNDGVAEGTWFASTFRDRAALLNDAVIWGTRVKASATTSTSLSGNAALLRKDTGFAFAPFASATATQNATFSGTRAAPGTASTFNFHSLALASGSSFELGASETLNLASGSGVLVLASNSALLANGTLSGSIYSNGTVLLPAARAATLNQIRNGFARYTPAPGTSAAPTAFSQGASASIQSGTLAVYGRAGFGAADTTAGPATGPRWYANSSGSLSLSGTLAFNGRYDLAGSLSQTLPGNLRLYIGGNSQGQTYSYLTASSANLRGGLQVVIQPELLGTVPNVGDTFDVLHAPGGITLPAAPQTLKLQVLMTAAGAQSLGLTLPAFSSGVAADPNALVSLPSSLFTSSLVDNGQTLRLTLAEPICVAVPAPAVTSGCAGGDATFTITPAGSGPFTFAWQTQAIGSNTWQPLTDDPAAGLGTISGSTTNTLTISGLDVAASGASFRSIVSNLCGERPSPGATLTIGTCRCSLADINGDGTADGSDFVAFINSFAIGDVAIDPAADVAGAGPGGLSPDGVIDGSDFVAFINAFAIGC